TSDSQNTRACPFTHVPDMRGRSPGASPSELSSGFVATFAVRLEQSSTKLFEGEFQIYYGNQKSSKEGDQEGSEESSAEKGSQESRKEDGNQEKEVVPAADGGIV